MHGCRVRRHRDEPSLYPADRHEGCEPERSDLGGSGSRRRLTDLLVIDHRHFHQVCAPDHARRQPRRGRDPRASRLGESAPRQEQPAASGHGHRRSHRCHVALRRRHHHSGDFGAERHRGHQALRAADGEIRGPADARDPRGAVRHPAQGYLLDGRHIRTGHAGVVRGHRHSRNHGNCQGAGDSPRAQSPAGNPLFIARGTAGVGGDRRCFPGGHRRRGVLCRHGPFRSAAHSRRLVRRGAAGADAQLFRSGGTPADGARGDGKLLLSAGPGMVALRSGRACNGCHRHRLPVDHLRRLFDDAARPSSSAFCRA